MPRAELARVLAEVTSNRDQALQYGWPEGEESLRGWIARRLSARGAEVDSERVIITSGAQQALAMVGAAHRAERIAVGAETYPAAIAAFRQAGARVVVDGDVTTSYVMPGVSNPHGVDRVEPSRARWLAQPGLIVDEAYSELRFDGRLARPLVADAPDRVWHIGTFSKTVTPGLRVGWLIPPARDHEAVLDIKSALDLQTASLTQLAMRRLVQLLDYDALVVRARAFYRERAGVLMEALHRHVPGIHFTEPEGGFSIWIETGEIGDDVGLLEHAVAAGVSIDPGSIFRPRGTVGPVAMRVSFSSMEPEKLVEGARRLGTAIERWLRNR
jgi:2-aminoadipate transaminase